MSKPKTVDEPADEIPLTHMPPKSDSRVDRMLKASVMAAGGGIFGYILGSLGDSKDRQLAKRVMAAMGTVFGFAMSMYASKGKDLRPYDMSNAPEVLRHHVVHPSVHKLTDGPQMEIDGTSAMREGSVEEMPHVRER